MSEERAMMPIASTREEVDAQPATVARVLESLRKQVDELAQELTERNTTQILASGSGDSWFAAQAVRLAFERYAGVQFEPLQAYEYAAYGHAGENEKSAHLIISSSGRPTTTWDALDRALASGSHVVGITDNDDSSNPFVSRPPVALIPGAVKAGWPTQTTTATIALLLDLAVAFGLARGHLSAERAERLARALRILPEQMEETLAKSAQWAADLAPSLASQRVFFLVGGGPSYGVAQNGSALLAEGPQEIGLALTVEEFHHGLRVATLQQGEPVLLIAPDGETAKRCRETARSVRAWGARLIPLTSGALDDLQEGAEGMPLPDTEEPLSPLLTLLPLQSLSIELASGKVAGGYSRPESVP